MDIIISNSSDEPIYQQIVKQIKNLIIKGELAENEMLPSIRTLAKELQISVITTKRAYQELENEGYIGSSPK
ncbi:GntR family transcriptional regulator, partial [Geobacillus thermoleovorans]|uniref:GntR family transcriptional regulator n=1 Tax=Geobacillus thermoleovorans TaxID=33941 RepID=UPI003D25B61C